MLPSFAITTILQIGIVFSPVWTFLCLERDVSTVHTLFVIWMASFLQITAILQIGICPIFVKLASHMLHLKCFICSSNKFVQNSPKVKVHSISIMMPDSANVIEDRLVPRRQYSFFHRTTYLVLELSNYLIVPVWK